MCPENFSVHRIPEDLLWLCDHNPREKSLVEFHKWFSKEFKNMPIGDLIETYDFRTNEITLMIKTPWIN